MKALSGFFLNNLIAFYVLWGLCNMLGFHSYEGGMVKIVTLLCILYSTSLKLKGIDFIILFYVLYCLFSFGWSDIPWRIYYVGGVENQLMPISLYFIVRTPPFKSCKLLENMKWPLLFAFIAALYLYFYNPSWYYAFKTRNWTFDHVGDSYYERTRLSGFWPWPYFIGYSSLFYLMWEITKLSHGVTKKMQYFFYISITISIAVLFFSQLRVAIAFFFVYIILLCHYTYSQKLVSFKVVSRIIVAIIIGSVLTLLILYYYAEADFVSYVLGRSVESKTNFVNDRIMQYSRYIDSISLFGDGLGSHSHYGRSILLQSITDCEYIRIPNEIGVVGMALLLTILLSILLMAIKNYSKCFFEMNIMIFLFMSMMGAAPLEHLPLHPYIYWFCMGRIVNVNQNSNVSFARET